MLKNKLKKEYYGDGFLGLSFYRYESAPDESVLYYWNKFINGRIHADYHNHNKPATNFYLELAAFLSTLSSWTHFVT